MRKPGSISAIMESVTSTSITPTARRPDQPAQRRGGRHDRVAGQRGHVLRRPLRDLLHPAVDVARAVGHRDRAPEHPVSLTNTIILVSTRSPASSASSPPSGCSRAPPAGSPRQWGMVEWFFLTYALGAIFVAGQILEYATLVTEGITLELQRLRLGLLPHHRLPRPARHRRAHRLPARHRPRLRGQELRPQGGDERDRRLVLLALRRRRLDRAVPGHLRSQIGIRSRPHHHAREHPHHDRTGTARKKRPASPAGHRRSDRDRAGLHRRRLRAFNTHHGIRRDPHRRLAGIGRRGQEALPGELRHLPRHERSRARPTAPASSASVRHAVDFQVGTGRMPMRCRARRPGEAGAVHRRADRRSPPTSPRSPPARPSPSRQYLDGNGDAANGAELFRINCAMCHNVAGAGGALTEGKFAPR